VSNYEEANKLAVLNGIEDVNWAEQTAWTGAPTGGSVGISVLASQVAMLALSMRRYDVSKRTCFVQITYDAATTYTVNVDGNSVGTAANASLLQTLTDIRDNIIADNPGAFDVVTATLADLDGDGINDAVKLVGKAEADYSLVISVAGGAGTVTAVADPTDGSYRLFRAPTGISSAAVPPSWRLVEEGDLRYQGKAENYNVGGTERLYVEYHSLGGLGDSGTITYNPRADIGPGIIP